MILINSVIDMGWAFLFKILIIFKLFLSLKIIFLNYFSFKIYFLFNFLRNQTSLLSFLVELKIRMYFERYKIN